MTDRQYVINGCKLKGLSLIKPSKAEKSILAIDYSTGFGRCVIVANTWAEAKQQLNAWAMQ